MLVESQVKFCNPGASQKNSLAAFLLATEVEEDQKKKKNINGSIKLLWCHQSL